MNHFRTVFRAIALPVLAILSGSARAAKDDPGLRKIRISLRTAHTALRMLSFALLAAFATASASAQTFDVGGQSLNFAGGGSGSGTSVNSFRNYTNVITINGTQIDARVTLTAVSAATVGDLDSTTNPYAESNFLQPTVTISSPGGFATFKVEFFANGQPATLKNFYANTYDLDGAGASASGRQYTDFRGFASFALSDNTRVTTQSISGGTRFVTTVGGNLNYAIGTADFNSIRARVFYTSASSVTFSVGDTSASGLAFYGVDFSVGYTFGNVAADTTAPVVSVNQSFSYAENQVTDATVATVAATDAIGVTAFRFGATSTTTSADGYYTIDNIGAVKITAAGVAAGVANNDFETAPNAFTYAVQASDAADNWSNAVNIALNVLDVVETTAPVFTSTNTTDGSNNPSYSFTYDENSASGVPLGTVSATGTGTLSFSITSGNSSSWFAIDATTGAITLTQAGSTSQANDFETQANIQTLTVAVSDGTNTTTIEVALNEGDVDEAAPVITGPSGTAGDAASAISVNENQTVVTQLLADETVTWSITGGTDAASFAIATDGTITFAVAPDFENPTDSDADNSYVVEVKAIDAAGNFSSQTVTVTVLDVVETTAPVFTSTNTTDGSNNPSYRFTYDENSASGVPLGSVSATGTGTLSFSITSGNSSSWFAIDATTGAITLTQAGRTSLANDFETQANIQTLTVAVSDGTNTTTIEVALNEGDVDEAAPVITGPSGTAGDAASAISVNENQTAVTQLLADETVTWSITGGTDAASFAIAIDGTITFLVAPDFENPTDSNTNNSYVLTVTATDADGNLSTQTVTVTVLDVNDTAPVFTSTNATDGSNNPSYSFTYDENRASGATLDTVSAAGAGTLRYSVTSGNSSSWFAIDAITGAITLTQAGSTSQANDFETQTNVQTLTVQVSDGTRTTTIEVKLNERNVDDVELTSISGAVTRANRSTGGGAGVGIGGRTVTLIDSNNNVLATTTTASNGSYRFDGVVPGTYSVQFTNGLATSTTGNASGSVVSNISVAAGATVAQVNAVLIDPSGVVYDSVRRTPISNAQVSLYFGGAKVSNSWLDLTIGGANDQQTGADGRYSFILASSAASGTYEIRVTGPAGYTNTESTLIRSSGTVSPSLGGGLDNVQSQGTAPTGTQATTYYLQFNFTIGTDAASTSNGIGNNHIPLDPAAAPLAFTGTNATDTGNRPSYSFNYNEGRSQGATLGAVSASGGYSANRTFSITGGNTNGWFAVGAANGAVTLTASGAASLANDFEALANVHDLVVQVSDGFGTVSVEVKLGEANIDDSAPLITGPTGGAGATESAITIDEGLTQITTMSANEGVTWTVVGGADQSKIVIDRSTGALSFITAPNYESPTDTDRNNSYVVQVRATDANGNVALQTVTVTIRNVDEIARKLAQIAEPLRNSLRSYAARSLSDMLSFNEQLLQGRNENTCTVNGRKPISGGFNANSFEQSARINYSKLTEDCARHYRVFADGAMAVSGVQGDWSLRTLGSVRVEADVNSSLTLGAGVLGTFAYENLTAFADSSILDTSVQFNLYGRQRITDTLRVAAFAGYGKAWYDFSLSDDGFDMTGKMTGNRLTYGGTLTGDVNIGKTILTTDLIVSRATEKLGTARLAASYLGEQRSDIGFFVGNVDVTRVSVPVHLPIDFLKPAFEGGNATRMEISPGMLCEDNSVDSSSIACGFQADAKLLVTRGGRTNIYFDASFETVGGVQRYMGGTGFGYRFGRKNAIELGVALNAGTAGIRQEARGILQLKVVQ